MKKKVFIFLSVVISLTSFLPLYAQDTAKLLSADSSNSLIGNQPPEPEETSTKVITPMSHFEFTLSLIVLAFGLLVILLEIFLIKSKRISSEETIKFIIITLIITSTLFLITAGYSNDQIAPAVGLLGTIAGYLLGRIQHSNQKDDKNETSS